MKSVQKGKRKQPYRSARARRNLPPRAAKVAVIKRWGEEARVARLKTKKRNWEHTYGKIIRSCLYFGLNDQFRELMVKRERIQRLV